MKRILLFAAALCACGTAAADEGMWLLPYLQKMNIADMRDKGCRLKAEDIYRIDGSSLKDAIVVFGRGCTGEIVSPEGLVFTNHHCGYGSIQALSSVDHDYLKNGFWAMNNAEELPVPGLEIRFVRRILDVTPDLLGNVPNIAGEAERARIVEENTRALTERLEAEHEGMEIQVKSFFGGNRYFAFVMEVFKDIRLVGAPPSSIGKFGGDTDNWIWPRHTGDFSVFRIYASPDNRPAAYSPENVPYRPRRHFAVSARGAEEGAFTMIYGFPGNTQQYILSDAVEYVQHRSDPMKIDLRTQRLDLIAAAQEADPAVRIKYAAKHALIANPWKKWQGEVIGLERLGTADRKRDYERRFAAWAADKPEYAHLLDSMRAAYAAAAEPFFIAELINETGRTIELALLAEQNLLRRRAAAAGTPWSEAKPELEKQYLKLYDDYDAALDRRLAKCVLHGLAHYYPGGMPRKMQDEIDRAGGTIDAYVDALYDRSPSVSRETAEAADTAALAADPVLRLRKLFSFGPEGIGRGMMLRRNLSDVPSIERWYRPYLRALRAFDPGRAFFPDANSTLRVAYGSVRGYDYADGEYHKPLTTLDGLIAKDNPAIYDYDIPQSLRDLHASGDYGRWSALIDGRRTVPVCFLADNQTTGGNSGSPVLNARGELIGINFDRTWRSTMSDIEFDPELCRNIAVDIRYVLTVIDRIGGAGRLIDEMTIR